MSEFKLARRKRCPFCSQEMGHLSQQLSASMDTTRFDQLEQENAQLKARCEELEKQIQIERLPKWEHTKMAIKPFIKKIDEYIEAIHRRDELLRKCKAWFDNPKLDIKTLNELFADSIWQEIEAKEKVE